MNKDPQIRCQEYSEKLNDIENWIFQFASLKKLDKKFDNEIRKYIKLLAELPDADRVIGMMRAQYAIGVIMTNPINIRKFLTFYIDAEGGTHREFIKSFIDQPWFFGVVTIDESSGDEFLEVTEHLSGYEYTLQSAGVADISSKFPATYFLLLMDNGECLQTYSTISYFKGLQPSDFEYMAKLLNPQGYKTSGAIPIIHRDSIPFQVLFVRAELPLTAHGNEILRLNGFAGKARTGTEALLDEKWQGELVVPKIKRYEVVSSGGSGIPDEATLYLNTKTCKIEYSSMSIDSFERGVELLEPVLGFRMTPDYQPTMTGQLLIKEITGKDCPGFGYSDPLGDKELSEPEKQAKDKVEKAIEDIIDAQNRGYEVDMEVLSARYGLDEEFLRDLSEKLKKNIKNQ